MAWPAPGLDCLRYCVQGAAATCLRYFTLCRAVVGLLWCGKHPGCAAGHAVLGRAFCIIGHSRIAYGSLRWGGAGRTVGCISGATSQPRGPLLCCAARPWERARVLPGWCATWQTIPLAAPAPVFVKLILFASFLCVLDQLSWKPAEPQLL